MIGTTDVITLLTTYHSQRNPLTTVNAHIWIHVDGLLISMNPVTDDGLMPWNNVTALPPASTKHPVAIAGAACQ